MCVCVLTKGFLVDIDYPDITCSVTNYTELYKSEFYYMKLNTLMYNFCCVS